MKNIETLNKTVISKENIDIQLMQEQKPQQENSTLSLKSKLIRDYKAYDFTLWGAEDSLNELSHHLGLLYDSQQLARVSDVMEHFGLEPDTDAYDCWWGLDYLKDEDEDEDEVGKSLVVTEFTKGEFNDQRLIQVLKKMEKAKGLTSMSWEQVFLLDL